MGRKTGKLNTKTDGQRRRKKERDSKKDTKKGTGGEKEAENVHFLSLI